MFCLGAALFGGMILLPLYWQQIRHESVVDTGLLTAPQGLGMALVMPLAGKLSDRFGGGPLALFGVIVTTVATIPFGLIGTNTSILYLSIAMFVRGMGIGFAFMPAMAAAFAALDRSELADATPQLNVLQRVGGSIGTAVLAVVLQLAMTGVTTAAGAASAYGTAFWVSAGMTALAIIPCIILVRAERVARARRRPTRPARPRRRSRRRSPHDRCARRRSDGRCGGGSRRPSRDRAAHRARRVVQGRDGRASGACADASRTRSASSASPSTASCSGSPPSHSSRPASSRASPISHPRR